MDVRLVDRRGMPRAMTLRSTKPDKDGKRLFPFNVNAILGLEKNMTLQPPRDGIYTRTFPNFTTLPAVYEIKVHPARRTGVPTIIRVPPAVPVNEIRLNVAGTAIPPVAESGGQPGLTLGGLLETPQLHAWCHDAGIPGSEAVYVRTTTIVEDPLHDPEAEGTKNHLYINALPWEASWMTACCLAGLFRLRC